MWSFDRFFKIVFARYRRELGESQITDAWWQAYYNVAADIVIRTAAIALFIQDLSFLGIAKGSSFEHLRFSRTALVATGVASILLLGLRFRKYLEAVPELDPQEYGSDTDFVSEFRMVGYVLLGMALVGTWIK